MNVPTACRTLVPGYDPWATAQPGHVFDEAAAQRACDFFPTLLRHIEGQVAGKPFVLEPWQQAIIGNLFGWKRADGTRRYREAFVYVPRKNGKTPLCAGIALYLLMCDGEKGGQVYSAAAEREQAALVFRHAAGMVLQEPELDSRTTVRRTYKTIEHPNSGSIYKALSADAKTKHGLNIHGLIVDELHAHPDGELVDTLLTGTASRAQPLSVHITTADYERESICNRKYAYACAVRDNGGDPDKPGCDPAFFPCVWEVSVDDDWTDEGVWERANPNLDVSVSRDYLRRECERAKEEPSYLNTFLRLHLNVKTNADIAWLDMKAWDRCAEECDPDELRGRPCYGGLDLSKTTDLTAFSLYFPETDHVMAWFFIPEDRAAQAERRDRVPYGSWSRRGYVEQTPGNVTDYNHVAGRVMAICAEFNPIDVGYDPWNATQMAQGLTDEGLAMVEFRQGYRSMSEPSKALERLVMSGELKHGGNPVLRWNAANAMIRMDPTGAIKPDKAKSTGRIDGVVAAVMAIGRHIVSESRPSIYETEGVFTV